MTGRALNQPTLVGRKLGHHRIVEEIGAGGMGVVYRAHDEHLDREVAIKVLPSGTLSDESARRRLRKEARSLSKLNHPNVAMVHDFDSQEDIDYLVMEYVPGKTLRDRISEGPLPQAEIIRLATQLAKGLTAAHERGLVHRDLKPENLRLTLEGRLKILDFGLAELIRPFADLRTTESNISAVAGTLPYMAPEQVQGGIVDQRADLFAFGIVLYEMATGQHPFAEPEPSHVAAAILHRTPAPPTALNPKLSAELERVTFKCLEKHPDKRYQSAKDLAADLRHATLAAHTSWRPWVIRLRKRWARKTAVVLGLGGVLVIVGLFFRTERVHGLAPSDTIVLADFVNSTADPVFNDALSQGLTIELEQSPFLKILPQTKIKDTLRLMGQSPGQALTPEISREVCQRTDAKAVLLGSIAPLGTQYVIGLTAVECSTGNRLANEQIQSVDKEGVLKALGKAASGLRVKLGESLSSVQKFDKPLEQATTPSLEALTAYSLGRKTQYQQGNSASIPLFKRAIELDPNFAVAYSALGIAYSNLGEPGLANENLQRAYELRDRISEREKLRISAAYHSYLDGDLLKGSEIYELWAKAYPRDGVPPGNLGAINSYLGRYEKAVAQTLEHLRLGAC